MSDAVLEVVDAGLLATIQDAGRPGLEGLGVTPGGAADRLGLAVANAIVGNAAGDAVIELTLPGAVLRALRPVTLGLAGADLGARVRGPGGTGVAPGSTFALVGGSELAFQGRPSGDGASGCRAYVAVPGGVDVPVVLGARATALGAGFGGLEGRALRAGDRLSAIDPSREIPPGRWPGSAGTDLTRPIRVLPGPHPNGADGPGDPVFAALAGQDWTIGGASDRVGLRLEGGTLPGASTGELASHGVVAGSVQRPPDGSPIVLGVDHQPTGGYPVVAVVIEADLDALGQLAPGDRVRFEIVDRRAAVAARAVAGEGFRAALDALAEDRRWDALWRGAGG